MKFLGFLSFLCFAFSKITVKDQTQFYKNWLGDKLNFGIESGIVTVDGIPDHATSEDINQYFYQMIYQVGKSQGKLTSTDPIIIWLTGGPGVTTHYTIFIDQGPIKIDYGENNKNFVLSFREWGWNKAASFIYIDNPFGTGFSWSSSKNYISNTEMAANYFAEFLVEFFIHHTELVQCPLYIFGESFGGHYVPVFARKIIEDKSVAQLGLNFKGIGIGDGIVDLNDQISYMSSYLFSIGAVDAYRQKYFQNLVNSGEQAILNNDFITGSLNYQQLYKGDIVQKFVGISPYNYQLLNDNNWRNSQPYTDFLNQYKSQFDIPDFLNLVPQNQTIFKEFTADLAESKLESLQFLLDHVRVLLFNGQLDYIINTGGALKWINKIQWSKINEWKKQDKKFFKYKSNVVGTIKTYENFQVVQIYAAGHTITEEQIEVGEVMLSHFLNGDTIWE